MKSPQLSRRRSDNIKKMKIITNAEKEAMRKNRDDIKMFNFSYFHYNVYFREDLHILVIRHKYLKERRGANFDEETAKFWLQFSSKQTYI